MPSMMSLALVWMQGQEVLDTDAAAGDALLATAASLFPDPLQTANSEALFNTMDPLSSINSTMNIHDTLEAGRVGHLGASLNPLDEVISKPPLFMVSFSTNQAVCFT